MIAQHVPPELLRQAELEWRQQSFKNRVSKTHKCVLFGPCLALPFPCMLPRDPLLPKLCWLWLAPLM